ncbi:MAG: FAD-binding protein [Zetaproteobacteria bacterium]|nr:FAD-binding protein [Zetaproteobacteria bacterium]
MKISDLAYYRTGGYSAYFFAPESLEELVDAVSFCARAVVPAQFLGAGSNSLVSDQYFPGATISLHKMSQITRASEGLLCQAGALNTQISQRALEEELSGAAWMHGLPGSIGATARMNARCYGGEISHLVVGVTLISEAGHVSRVRFATEAERKAAFKGYKDTLWMRTRDLIAEVELALPDDQDVQQTRVLMERCLADRQAKHQFDFPSCGCVFKNDYRPAVSVSSGLLLDLAGAKSLDEAKVGVSPYHANFLFNKNRASSRDILEMTFAMREKVWAEFGVWLAYEMEFLGFMPHDLGAQFYEQRPENLRHDRLQEARAVFQQK